MYDSFWRTPVSYWHLEGMKYNQKKNWGNLILSYFPEVNVSPSQQGITETSEKLILTQPVTIHEYDHPISWPTTL